MDLPSSFSPESAASLLETKGLIRYSLPGGCGVSHVTFRAADCQPGCGPSARGAFVLFTMCTDLKAAARIVAAAVAAAAAAAATSTAAAAAVLMHEEERNPIVMPSSSGGVRNAGSAHLHATSSEAALAVPAKAQPATSAASAARVSARGSHHAVNRALNVMGLAPAAVPYLSAQQQREHMVLDLLGLVFPSGASGSNLDPS